MSLEITVWGEVCVCVCVLSSRPQEIGLIDQQKRTEKWKVYLLLILVARGWTSSPGLFTWVICLCPTYTVILNAYIKLWDGFVGFVIAFSGRGWKSKQGALFSNLNSNPAKAA